MFTKVIISVKLWLVTKVQEADDKLGPLSVATHTLTRTECVSPSKHDGNTTYGYQLCQPLLNPEANTNIGTKYVYAYTVTAA